MEVTELIIQFVTGIVCSLVGVMSTVLFLRFRWPAAAMWGLKVLTSALSPLFSLIGLLTFFVGLATNSAFLIIIAIYVTVIYLIHVISVTRPPRPASGFEQAFGLNWKNKIKADQKKYFRPYRLVLKLPAVPEPRLEQNISFATIPGTGRKLLCDVWQPSTRLLYTRLIKEKVPAILHTLPQTDQAFDLFFPHCRSGNT